MLTPISGTLPLFLFPAVWWSQEKTYIVVTHVLIFPDALNCMFLFFAVKTNQVAPLVGHGVFGCLGYPGSPIALADFSDSRDTDKTTNKKLKSLCVLSCRCCQWSRENPVFLGMQRLVNCDYLVVSMMIVSWGIYALCSTVVVVVK